MLLICLIVLGMGETVTISQFEDMYEMLGGCTEKYLQVLTV